MLKQWLCICMQSMPVILMTPGHRLILATMLAQAVRMQVTIEQEVANAKEMKSLSRILVKLLTSHKDASPFHIQTIMHRSDLDKLRDDEVLKERLAEILAEARERLDLGAAAQKLLQVRNADSLHCSGMFLAFLAMHMGVLEILYMRCPEMEAGRTVG